METSHDRWTAAVWSGLSAVLVALAVCAVGTVTVLATGPAAATPYQLKAVKLASGATTPARWNPCQKAVVWRDNLRGLPAAKRAGMLNQMKTGFNKLAAATGITYRYAGTTTFVPRQGNLVSQPADIVVAAVDASQTDLDIGEKSLGFGGVLWATWYGSSGEGAAVVRGYVVLIPSGVVKLKPGFGPGKTQGDVIQHELGHASGLEHVQNAGALMYPYLTASAPNGYTRGELNGLAKLGTKAGCIAVPERVNIKDYD
jgi:Matrixin